MTQTSGTTDDTALIAELNDLLKLDYDAVSTYGMAISSLKTLDYQSAIDGFRTDHERHIAELGILIRARNGTPADTPHLAAAPIKLGMQAMGGAAGNFGGGDAAVLLAFKANERLSRDKYRRAAHANHPADVVNVLARAAEDEARHYAWVLEALDDLGIHDDSATMRAERVVEVANAGMSDAIERVRRNPIGSALVALGVGLVAAAFVRDR